MKMLKLLVAGTILAASSVSMADTLGQIDGTWTNPNNTDHKVVFTIVEESEGNWRDIGNNRTYDDVNAAKFLNGIRHNLSNVTGSMGSIMTTMTGTQREWVYQAMGLEMPKPKAREITLRGELVTYENGDMRILWINADGTTLLGPVLEFHDSDYNWNGTDVEVNPKVQDINPKVQDINPKVQG